MFGQREQSPEETTRTPRWSLTIVLLVINVIVFIVQNIAGRFYPQYPFDYYFALSLDGLRHGYFWQLITYQFMHGGLLHIFFNSWAILIFGRAIEMTLGKSRMLRLYLLSGVVGGMLQMVGAWISLSHFGGAVVGASAAAYGLVAAFTVFYPRQELVLLIIFIPVRMRARTLLWISIAMSVVGIIIPYGNIGHAAHLGGMLTGVLLAHKLVRQYRVPPVIDIATKSSLNASAAPD